MSLADRTERKSLIKAGLPLKSLERLYLAEEGFTVVKFPILPTEVMV